MSNDTRFARFQRRVAIRRRLPLLLWFGAALVQALPARAQPRIEIRPQVVDVGVVAKGEIIKASVVVANRGDATLKVWRVLGPSNMQAISLELAPGQEQVMALSPVDTTGFTGPITKAILFFTNDPTREQVNIVVKAEVLAFIEVLPRHAVRLEINEGEKRSANWVLASKDPFEITGVTAGDPRVSVSFEPTTREGFVSAYALTLRLDGREPWGIVSPNVLVRTTHAFVPTIKLFVYGVIRPIVQVVPADLNFGTTKASQERNVLVLYNGHGADFALREPQVDDPAFRVEMIPLQPGKRFQLMITVAVDAKLGNHQATITLGTTDPSHPRVTIPIIADVVK